MDYYNIRKIWNPDWFQGNRRRKAYFEGWYFKLVNADKKEAYAVIPGISIGEKPEQGYSFIQVINGISGETRFIKYNFEDFSFSRNSFEISISGNRFSNTGLKLNLPESGFGINGEISFRENVPYPVRLFSPGVMGWYRFVPTMECYHGIVSMLHDLQGELIIADKKVEFSGGKGYIEKDWGKSMPLAWIWMQSNHFIRKNLSFSFSVANIPWKKSAFTGFLIILSEGERFYRFTTYTGSRITRLSYEGEQIEIEVQNRHYHLFVSTSGAATGNLKAPVHGEMSRTIKESIGAVIKLRLEDRKGNVILEDSGDPGGLEIAGDIGILQSDLTKK
jgi:tocopherol cyclase